MTVAEEHGYVRVRRKQPNDNNNTIDLYGQKDASESKHVNRYDDMVGRCCSREPCDTYAITLIS